MTPPTLVSASSVNGRQIGICFSEEMDASSLSIAENYLAEDSGGLKGTLRATPQPDGRGVVLTVDPSVEGEFVVTVGFLFDLAGNLLEPGSTITGRVVNAGIEIVDIGATSPTGMVFSCVPGQLQVQADGELINVRFDRLGFLYVRRTNDFDVQVRLNGLGHVTSPYASAGLMVRQSLDPNSMQECVLATSPNAANRIYVVARAVANAMAGHIENGPQIQAFPIWLRLKRSSTFVTAFVSRDGASWLQAGTSFSLPGLPAETLVGLATASGSLGSAVTADYSGFGDTVLYPNATLAISTPPASLAVETPRAATFSVSAVPTGAPPEAVRYQWQAETAPGSGEFTNIYFATGSSYSSPPLAPGDSGTSFRIAVGISGHDWIVSPAAVVTVLPDTTGPRLLQATGGRALREFLLTFSEPLERISATTLTNYSVEGMVVTNAVLDPVSNTRVLLQCQGIQTLGATNRVQLLNLTDTGGRLLTPNPTVTVAPALSLAPGYVLRELYYGVAGSTLASLIFSPFYPSFPNDFRYLTELEGPNDILWEYGTRLSGFLIPPVTGSYNFWMCSDDQGDFRIAPDGDPSHVLQVCFEPAANSFRDYLGTANRNATAPENRSQTQFPNGIPLQAGQPCYFEAVSKNAALYGNLSVAWQIPGDPPPTNGSPPIPGRYLAGLIDASRVTLEILRHPQPATLFASTSSASRLLLVESFTFGDGGFTADVTGDPTGGWTYRDVLGAWTTDGSGSTFIPSDKRLTSPPLTVTTSGRVELVFNHRYNFEYDGAIGWDGGQVRLSVNGGPFVPVPPGSFFTNGYNRKIQGIASLLGQDAFNGPSIDYANSHNVTSGARLGYFQAGQVLRFQFDGGWDEWSTATAPNWVIDSVQVTEGVPGAPPVSFSVEATGAVSFAPNQPIAYHWQRSCGQDFTDIPGATEPTLTLLPEPGDLGCQFRCVVSLPGKDLVTQAAALLSSLPALVIRQEAGQLAVTWTVPGRLEQGVSAAGPWSTVPGVSGTRYVIPQDGPFKFFRLVSP
jgi:hypothetical protein